MDFRGDERGQPVLIGAILLFAMLVLAFATYQGAVVPNQNAEVEYNHFQQVEGQFSELRTSATNAIGSGEQRSVTISLGTRYPARLIALNPSAPSGSLETTGEGEVEIQGLDYSAADLCATDANKVTSRSLRYQPSYHEHRSAESITYENTFRARSFRSGETQFDGQSLVQPGGDGEATRINLLVLTGSFSRSGGESFDLDLDPTHRYTRDVSSDGGFDVTIPSRFSAKQWEASILGDNEVVEGVQNDGDQVKIIFASGDYRVSCAVVGLNNRPAYQPPGGDTTFDTRWSEERQITVRPAQGTETLSMIATDRDSLAPISNASVDYAYSSSAENTGEISFYGPGTGITDETGENATVVDVSAADDGDTFSLYTDAGDDSDLITLNIGEARFTFVEAGNVSEGTNETQTFTIELNEAVRAGDEIEIDLDDPYGTSNNEILYPKNNASLSTTGEGSLWYESGSGQGGPYSIFYTVAESDAESGFEIVVEDIDSDKAQGEEYNVPFELRDAEGNLLDTDDDSFHITPS